MTLTSAWLAAHLYLAALVPIAAFATRRADRHALWAALLLGGFLLQDSMAWSPLYERLLDELSLPTDGGGAPATTYGASGLAALLAAACWLAAVLSMTRKRLRTAFGALAGYGLCTGAQWTLAGLWVPARDPFWQAMRAAWRTETAPAPVAPLAAALGFAGIGLVSLLLASGRPRWAAGIACGRTVPRGAEREHALTDVAIYWFLVWNALYAWFGPPYDGGVPSRDWGKTALATTALAAGPYVLDYYVVVLGPPPLDHWAARLPIGAGGRRGDRVYRLARLVLVTAAFIATHELCVSARA